MATLNTMRTRWGWVITGFIFLAIVMFVVSDVFSSGGGLMGSNDVGEISGETVSYEDFVQAQEQLEIVYQAMYNTNSIPAQMADQINDQIWSNFILEHTFLPSFAKAGISVGADEALDMVDGTYLSPIYSQVFYDPTMMRDFLTQTRSDNRAYALWQYLKNQASIDRMMNKYSSVVEKGFWASDLAVEKATQIASTTYNARALFVPYTTIVDSTVVVSQSAVKEYYDSHKSQFRQATSRDVEYVVFDMSPSEADFQAADADVKAIAEEFRAEESPMQYVSISAKLRFAADTMYMRASNVPADLAEVAEGTFQEPTLSGNVYTMARLVNSKVQPDTVGFTAITPDGETDAGKMAIEQLNAELKTQVLDGKVGDIVSMTDPYGNVQELKINYKNAPVRLVQIAKVEYVVYPSSETQTNVYNEMNAFAAAAGKTADSFRAAVDERGISKRNVRIRPEERTINGLTDAKPLINWTYAPQAKRGSISEALQVDGNYVVALLADIHKEGYMPIEQVEAQIRSILINEEKARMISEKISGTTLDQMAASVAVEVQDIENVSLTMPFISQFGYEPKVAGAIASTKIGAVSKPVAGAAGVYVVSTTEQLMTDESTTAEDHRVRLNANAVYNIQQRLMQAIYELSKITDMRVRYF